MRVTPQPPVPEAVWNRMSTRSTRSPRSGPDADGAAPDAVLLAQARDGEASAYSELLTRYRDRIAGYAYRLIGDSAAAEDVAQESFLRLWRTMATKPVEGNAGAWLHRVARNLAVDRLRLRKRDGGEVSETLPSNDTTAENKLQAKCTSDRVRAAMLALPERQRAAIALVHYQNLSGKDAAAQLEITVEALESLLARGRRKLREVLSAEKDNLGPFAGESQ